MNSNIANSKALGFGVLAIGLWMFSVVNAGIGGPAIDPRVMRMVEMIAMLGLLIAGLASFLRHESWLGFFFLLWSGVFWGAAHGVGQGNMDPAAMRYAGWFMMTIALVDFYLWSAAMKSVRLGSAISFMVLLLWLSFLALGLRGFFDFFVLIRVGGALGLASALVAFYVSAGAIAAECRPGMPWPGIVRDDVEPKV